MNDPVQHRAVRPLPGAVPADRAVRPRTWWDALQGWPAGLPVDRRLAARVRFEGSRTSVREDLHRRFEGRLAPTRQFSVATLLLIVVAGTGQHVTIALFGETLVAGLAYFAATGAVTTWVVHRSLRHVRAPWLRASLRREGADCCIDCGHLMGRGPIDDTCAECGRPHADFPLGWGPGPVNGASRATAQSPPNADAEVRR